MSARRIRTVVVAAAVWCSAVAGGRGAELHVPSEYSTIQGAINASQSGDVIIVDEGTYVERINFNGKNITVTGTGPDDWDVVRATVIDGDEGGATVTFGGSESSSCKLTGFTITGGYHSGFGGAIVGNGASATVTKCIVSGNTAYGGNGGAAYNLGVSSEISNCWITDNEASQVSGSGGAGGALAGCHGLIINCVISGNTAKWGGGLHNCDGNIINCTMVGNTCTDSEQSVVRACDGAITNCIIYYNTGRNVLGSAAKTYNCIQDWTGGGTGNISGEPKFVDADNGNYYLLVESPCIDAGDNNAVPAAVSTDIEGRARKIDVPGVGDSGNGTAPIVDMGAYEVEEELYSDIIYVDDSATGDNDGTSWADAYKYLQDALADDKAQSGNVMIWVATGTYYPDEDSQHPSGTGSQTATFQLLDDVAIYGGFPNGSANPGWDDRDPGTYTTALNGDIVPTIYDSYHVVTGSGTDGSAVLDGCKITGGWAYEYGYTEGGGMYNNPGSPVVRNCRFYNNVAANGAGMYNGDGSNPAVRYCTFESNSGVGMYNDGSSPDVMGCTFTSNGGAGMYNDGSSPDVIGCVFDSNVERGMYSGAGSNLMVAGCTFRGHCWCNYGGGGMYNNECMATVIDCTFDGNTTIEGGGAGMLNTGASEVEVINCAFLNNDANLGTGSYPTAGRGGGILNWWYSSVTVEDCTFTDNEAEWAGGAVMNDSGSATVITCEFEGNKVYGNTGPTGGGGAISNYEAVSAEVRDCSFFSNSAEVGGAMSIYVDDTNSVSVLVKNCVFKDNTTIPGPRPHGGAIYIHGGSFQLCTFYMNTTPYWGQGTAAYIGEGEVSDCIFYKNGVPDSGEDDIRNESGTVSYSDVVDLSNPYWRESGVGNINGDPLFVNADAGNFRLWQIAAGQESTSPCVDAGSNTAANLGMDEYTTRTDEVCDSGQVDMGYHYKPGE